MPTYLAITIDTECDKGPNWLTQRPLGFRGVTECIPEKLNPLFQSFGVRPTYLISPEVMRDQESISVLQTMRAQGAELGAHLHGEFIAPQPDENAHTTATMQNTYTREIEFQKLENLTRLFEKAFGFQPESFRAGRFGIGNNTLPILSQLGYSVDSSVAPYCAWSDNGGSTEFFGVPNDPYHPDVNDFKEKGSLPILEVPVTVSGGWYEFFPSRLLSTVPQNPLYWKVVRKLLKQKFKPLMFRPTFKTGTYENMARIIRWRIKNRASQDTFLVMMFHNVDFMPGCSPYAQSEEEASKSFLRLKLIFRDCLRMGIEFITLSEVPEILRKSLSVHGL